MRTRSSRVDSDAQRRRRRAHEHYARVRDRRARSRRRRQLCAAAIAIGLAGGVAAGTLDRDRWRLAAGGGPQAPVARIALLGNAHVSASSLLSAAGVRRGTPLAAISPERVEAALERHPRVRRARVLALPGATLLIGVEERECVAWLDPGRSGATGEAAAVRAIDRDGTPFDIAAGQPTASPPAGALVVHGTGEDVGSGVARPLLAEALALADACVEAGLERPVEIAVPAANDALGWRLRLATDGPEIVLGREGQRERLARLARLLDAGLAPVRAAARIDLRFRDRAVLRARADANTNPAVSFDPSSVPETRPEAAG